MRALLLAAVLPALGACATLSAPERAQVAQVVGQARSTQVDCTRADACAQPSALMALADAGTADAAPPRAAHQAAILDRGSDALLARINLLRGARERIELQTYIFDEDDAGHLVLDELMAAARRGVQVRVLIDQLSALEDVRTLAALSAAHANFRLRVYNPVLGRSRLSYPEYLLASLCCWRRLNQRMHSKLLVVDGKVGITGGRNYQNDYYDWDASYNFRDRDLLLAGPEVRAMVESFDAFWDSPRSVPAEQLGDVGKYLLAQGVPAVAHPEYADRARAEAMSAAADDAAQVQARVASLAMPVGNVRFIADPPAKHTRGRVPRGEDASFGLRALIESARDEVLLQTPYLVLSKPARRMFRTLRKQADPPRVVVSTNSLAATDAFIVYALSHKYKRRYLREFGFHIYEYKPFPADAPIDLADTGAAPAGTDTAVDADASRVEAPRVEAPPAAGEAPATADAGRASATRARALPARDTPRQTPLAREFSATRYFGSGANAPVPLRRAGVRLGLHAKSLVVDERVGVVGTHNFDPRGDSYNTESAVVIDDPAFARALAASIRRDASPANSWVIAPRDKPPVLSGLDYSLGKLSEKLPLFDFWPTRYATSYEFVPGPRCPQPVPRDHPDFRACHRPVGDFPEVSLGLKGITTRIFTAFGAGLAPIL